MRGLLLFSALLVGACLAVQGRNLQADNNADVIIIGAGMAGITTSNTILAKNPNVKLVILEARDRSGGRLVSQKTKYGQVDLGAMWIHEGRSGNPLYDHVTKTLNLPISPTQDYNSIALYQPDGDRQTNLVPFLNVARFWRTQVLGVINDMRRDPNAVDVPLSTIYENFLAEHPTFTEEQQWMANLQMHTNFQTLLNANITQLSTLRYGDAKVIPAIDVMLKDGFDATIEIMKKGTDIRYNTVVTKVKYTDAGVVVTTADGTEFTGKYALLTPSLGVLKAGHIEYDPPLPEYKVNAIEQMGFGLLDKTLMVFDKPFWDENSDFILRGPVDWSGKFCVFLNYYKLFKIPILAALNPAQTAQGIEKQTDLEVKEEVMKVLRSFYADKGPVPEPKEFYQTRWGQDEFSLGSYSYFATGNPLNITGDLAEPTGRLLWAGEATSKKPATVLGAYLSGLREAERLLGLLGTPKRV